MTAEEIRHVVNDACSSIGPQSNPMLVALKVQVATLMINGEIAAHLAELVTLLKRGNDNSSQSNGIVEIANIHQA